MIARRGIVAHLQQPVPRVEPFEQLTPPQHKRLACHARFDQLGEPARIDLELGRVDQPDLVAGCHQRPVSRIAERPTEVDERDPKAPACALVQHIRPQLGRDRRARVRAGMKRKPSQKEPCGAAHRRRERPLVLL